jgi:hypothetical protein
MTFSARQRDDANVDATIVTEWESMPVLLEFSTSVATPDAILRSLELPPSDIVVSLAEDL